VELRRAAGSAFVAGSRLRNLVKNVGLIVQIDCDGLQSRFVFTGVVGAKQELAARGQDRTKIRAGTTSVASIRGRQGSSCQYWCHLHVLLSVVYYCYATTTPPQNFPRRR